MSSATSAWSGTRTGSEPVKEKRPRELRPPFRPGYRLDEQDDKENAEDVVKGGEDDLARFRFSPVGR